MSQFNPADRRWLRRSRIYLFTFTCVTKSSERWRWLRELVVETVAGPQMINIFQGNVLFGSGVFLFFFFSFLYQYKILLGLLLSYFWEKLIVKLCWPQPDPDWMKMYFYPLCFIWHQDMITIQVSVCTKTTSSPMCCIGELVVQIAKQHVFYLKPSRFSSPVSAVIAQADAFNSILVTTNHSKVASSHFTL